MTSVEYVFGIVFFLGFYQPKLTIEQTVELLVMHGIATIKFNYDSINSLLMFKMLW